MSPVLLASTWHEYQHVVRSYFGDSLNEGKNEKTNGLIEEGKKGGRMEEK